MSVNKVRNVCALCSLMVTLSLSSGCIVVVASGCDWDHSPAVWTEETVQLPIDSVGLTALEVKTHNGEIEFAGQAAGAPTSVTVRKKAGGSSVEDAQEALSAIEVTSERSGGEQKLGWRWKGVKKSRWVGDVAFIIQAPGNLRFDAETHNGEVRASGIVGDAKILTHNGAVIVESRDGKLGAVTHNGAITATYGGPSILLETHNGEIEADLRQSGGVRGEMVTHNGAIELAVGSGTDADLVAKSNNGRVSHEGAIAVSRAEKSRLEGRLGAGGERLELNSHNGSISIKAAG